MRMTDYSELRAGARVLILPPHDVVVPGASNEDPSDEHDIEYNEWCTAKVKATLEEVAADNAKQLEAWDTERFGEPPARLSQPVIRTRYPRDDDDSEDLVSLEDGEVVVLDIGSR